jgi:maleylacetate reductase
VTGWPAPVVRFGAGAREQLASVCDELAVSRPLLVATRRGAAAGAVLPVVAVYDGVRPHVPVETVHEAAALARAQRADCLVGLGGGAAIDTCKAAAAELAAAGEDVPRIVAVPTTYAGAEWTPFFGVLLAPGRKGGGSDERARPAAALYDPELTLDLPLPDTVGTAMNALAHCAEAYYAPGADERAAKCAAAGAEALAYALPRVVAEPRSLSARSRMLEGAMQGAFALGFAGLCLAHAMAQALGGRYGLPHGAMNAICLPPALRFNAEAVPGAVARFAGALGVDDAPARCEELARLGGFARLRDHGVPAAELSAVAAAAAARPGARANPRPVDAALVEELLRSVW